METVRDFIFLGPKIAADGGCSHEIKRWFLLGSKAMANLNSALKSRDITLSTKVHLVKAMVFPIIMYGCEIWTIKKAENQRIMLLNCGTGGLLRVPWTARRSNRSILKEISPEYSLEGLMLKLKLQYFGHLMRRTDSLEKTLMLGKIKGKRRSGQQKMRHWMASPTQWTWVWASPRIGDGQGRLACYRPWGLKELDMSEQLNWYESFKCSGKTKISNKKKL